MVRQLIEQHHIEQRLMDLDAASFGGSRRIAANPKLATPPNAERLMRYPATLIPGNRNQVSSHAGCGQRI
jgi:hypothetical protein